MADQDTAFTGELLTTKQVSELTGFAVITLATWRVKGVGPSWFRVGPKRVAYDADEVRAWMRSRRYRSTSEATIDARAS